MSEIWKDITGYENLYMVSSAGRIKSVDRYVKNRNGVALKKGKILAPAKIDKTQYLKVSLCKNNKQKTFLVHRLVAEAFLEKNSEKTQVNHIDENPQNNNVENLEWCTPSYNVNFGTRNDRAALKRKENTVDGKEIAQLDMNGNVVGRHEGVMYYTLGQRRGLNIGGVKGTEGGRWFVVDKDVKNNRLIVSQGDESPLMSKALVTYNVNWIPAQPTENEFECYAKFRYRQTDQKVKVTIEPNRIYVQFKEPQRAVTPGQFVVFYTETACLGGGIIEEVIK